MRQKIIYFYLPSDTLVYSALPIIKHLRSQQQAYRILVPSFNESAAETLQSMSMPYSTFSKNKWDVVADGTLVLFNDWDKTARYVILDARKKGIPSICIQESMIDFQSKDRMKFADYVFLQSEFYKDLLDRKNVTVLGNPRYDDVTNESKRSDKGNSVMVNCNFTYGIFENVRESWLSQVSKALNRKELPFFISQHPRDSANVTNYGTVVRSNAANLRDQMNQTCLLISRFSSVIHEAVLFRIPVVYFNPHKESLIKNLNIDGKVVLVAHNEEDLNRSLQLLKTNPPSEKEYNHYIRYSITANRNASQLIASELRKDKFISQRLAPSDYYKMLFYHPSVRNLSRIVRKLIPWG